MKKAALLVLALLAITNAIYAQFYFTAGLGYAFPQAGQTLDGTATPLNGTRTNTAYSSTYTVKNVSFSSGMSGKLGLGYMFSDHVGAQLDAVIGLVNTRYAFTDNNVSYAGYNSNQTNTMWANTPVLLIPSVVLQTGGSSAWNIYSRWGLALPLISRMTLDENYYVPTVSVSDDYTFQLKNNFSIGLAASVGVQYSLNDKTTIWGEVSGLSLSLFLKQAVLKNVSENGVSVPLDSVGGPHTIQYSKNATVDTSYSKFPTYSLPFSNIGFNVGITIRLSDRKNRHSDDIDDNGQKYFRRKGSR